jgi:hypothetical protein
MKKMVLVLGVGLCFFHNASFCLRKTIEEVNQGQNNNHDTHNNNGGPDQTQQKPATGAGIKRSLLRSPEASKIRLPLKKRQKLSKIFE